MRQHIEAIRYLGPRRATRFYRALRAGRFGEAYGLVRYR